MEAGMTVRYGAVLLTLLTLSACTSLSQKSGSLFADKQPGIDQLDTITKEDKEEDAWFKSFYGSNHCGVWAGYCAPGTESSSGGTFWGKSIGPSDISGGTHSDGAASY